MASIIEKIRDYDTLREWYLDAQTEKERLIEKNTILQRELSRIEAENIELKNQLSQLTEAINQPPMAGLFPGIAQAKEAARTIGKALRLMYGYCSICNNCGHLEAKKVVTCPNCGSERITYIGD